MATKRMFSLSVVDTDWFLDLPLSAQALYFHLSMRADDDGFIDTPKSIIRKVGANQNDFDLLLAKRFILKFDSGVIVIKHWRLHNTIQKDRYSQTRFQKELSQLEIRQDKAYTEKINDGYTLETPCIQNVSADIDIDLDKDIDIDLYKKEINKEKKQVNIPYEEIVSYLNKCCDTRYRPNTNKTKSLINARFKEGFTVEDFKKVIDKKTNEWKGTDMEQYLRPETLFGTKFESYLNSKNSKGNNKDTEYKSPYDYGDFI